MRVMTGPVQWVLCDTVNVKGESPNQVLRGMIVRKSSRRSSGETARSPARPCHDSVESCWYDEVREG